MSDPVVTIEPWDELRAAYVGFARQVNAVRRGLRPRHQGASLWGGHIEGALAELAFCKLTGIRWTSEHALGLPPYPPDCGERTEIRWVQPGRVHYLYFDPRRDNDERVYVLVTGWSPTYTVLGSIRGVNARRQEWLFRYPERVVYRVPASALRRLEA